MFIPSGSEYAYGVTWIHLKLPQNHLQLFNTIEITTNIYIFKV